MKAKEIKKGIYWVGAIDWDLRNFHGYLTQRGTTYNAYLVIDEKITLIDTVKPPFVEEMFKRIADVIDPLKIDYLVSNHVEMDHSGSIPAVMEIVPDATVITSPNGEKGLKAHYKKDWDFKVVNSGDVVNLGKRNLSFILTPMVHWPDNMVGYMPEEKILFSNDAFGQHIASSERFDNEFPVEIILEEAAKYYANIVLPYSIQVQKVLAETSKLDIEIIANSHGIIWKEHIDKIIEKYLKWSSNSAEKKSVIIYDTMWGSTKKMAYAIQDAFESEGFITKMFYLPHNHISDIMTDVLDAEYICVGSPTLNKNIMPSVAKFLTYLKGLSPAGRKAIAFGSYGWGEQSIPQISKYFEDTGLEIIETCKIKFIPNSDELQSFTENLRNKI